MSEEDMQMATIGRDFPKTREARRAKLKEIKAQPGLIVGTIKVPGHGVKNVYRIPLEYLSYNPYNTRFLAQAKTLEARIGRELEDERPEDVKEIERFIWDYKKEKNDSTIQSLLKEGQLQPGVVTPSGLILAGNRRFRLLNEIQRNYNKYAKPGVNLEGLQYFEAAILENELDKKEIRRYEAFYQYGNEDKVEYDPIQKYIAVDVQTQLEYTDKEIADNFYTLTEGKVSIIEEWRKEFELMNEYLDYIGEPGIFTSLETREEAFINLYKTLKSYNGSTGNKIRPFDDFDLVEFKERYFDYIWKNLATHDFRDFKKIFNDKERWKIFNEKVKSIVKNVPESIDEYRKNNPDKTESEIAIKRQNDYIKLSGKGLDKALGNERAVIINRETEETPMKIVEQIEEKITKLEKIIESGNRDVVETEVFFEKIKNLQKMIGRIKQRLD